MSLSVKSLIERAKKLAERMPSKPRQTPYPSYLVKDRIKNSGVLLVHGPPGTGKTFVAIEGIRQSLDSVLDPKEIVMFVAPTNQLAWESLGRIITAMFQMGYNIDEIVNMVRLYGSKFDYGPYGKLASPPDQDTKIIFSTEWQRPILKDIERVNLIVDEASKTPLHTPIITLTNTIIKVLEEKRELYGSLTVLGDPMQAIMRGIYDTQHYMEGKALLLFVRLLQALARLSGVQKIPPNLNKLLEIARNELTKRGLFAQLKETKRIPEPLHEPINRGFYSGEIQASEKVSQRLKGVDLEQKNLSLLPQGVSEAFNIIEAAVSTDLGLIVARVTGSKSYKQLDEEEGVLVDPLRVKRGVELALAIALSTNMETLVTAPYVNMVNHMEYLAKEIMIKSGLPIPKNLRFGTVQSILGSESEAVVAVMGKEYRGTIYFMEPEILNVQLSREKKLLVVVGNPVHLLKNASDEIRAHATKKEFEKVMKYVPLGRTSKKLLELCGIDKIKTDLRLTRRRYEGDAGILFKLD